MRTHEIVHDKNSFTKQYALLLLRCCSFVAFNYKVHLTVMRTFLLLIQ